MSNNYFLGGNASNSTSVNVEVNIDKTPEYTKLYAEMKDKIFDSIFKSAKISLFGVDVLYASMSNGLNKEYVFYLKSEKQTYKFEVEVSPFMSKGEAIDEFFKNFSKVLLQEAVNNDSYHVLEDIFK